MKTGLNLFSRLLINAMLGLILAVTVGVPASVGAATVVGVSVLSGNFMPVGSAYAGVFTEIWTGELVKNYVQVLRLLGWMAFPITLIRPRTILSI